jgi:glycolate oxidase
MPTQLAQAAIRDLAQIVGEQGLLHGDAASRAYDCDAYTVDRNGPAVVLLPNSTAEVAQIVRWCVAREVPFTARGAGTGLSGGVLPALGGIVISTKRLTKILDVQTQNRCLLAEAGVPNKRLSEAVKSQGLHFAPDPSSQTVSTLGGNIAENAGGPHTLKYGVTANHILGVTLVTVEGEVVRLGGPIPGRPGLDFVGLIVGGEGTLGIVTEAWVKLTPLPKAVQTAVATFATTRAATEVVAAIIASGVIPAALEMMDAGILHAVRLAFGLEYPEGTAAMLLIECDGEPERVLQEMAEVEAVVRQHHATDFKVAQNEAERTKLWTARKKGVGAMGRLAPSIVTHDGVIPRSKLPEVLDFVYETARKHKLGVANLFHAGDGNLHPCFYFDDRDPAQVEAVVEAGEAIVRRCVELGGSITGEHGIGVEKMDLMPLMFSPEDLDLQARAKRIFNEGALCNPCKVLPNQKSCVEHKKTWRRSSGVAW